jgi:hypothetical protein
MVDLYNIPILVYYQTYSSYKNRLYDIALRPP